MCYFFSGLLMMKINRFAVIIFFSLLAFSAESYARETQVTLDFQQAAEKAVGFWNQRAYEEYTDMLNVSAISRRALKGFKLSEKQKLEFTKGFKIGIRRSITVTFDQIPETGYAKLLKTTPMDDGAKALVRVDFGDNGLGYLEIHLKKNPRGKIKIVDWHDYTQGRNISDVLRQLFITRMPADTVADRAYNVLTGKVAVRQQLTAMLKLLRKNKINEFERVYKTLGKEAKQNKSLMVLAVNMANMSQNEKLYRQALDDLHKYHGDDASVSFLLIDHLFYQQHYDEAILSVDKFQTNIGMEDVGLMMLKSNMLTMKGKSEAGARLAARAIEKEPGFESAYWSLFFGLAKSGQYQQAIKTAAILEDKFGYRLDNTALAEDEAYDGLLQSQVFKQWRAGRQ